MGIKQTNIVEETDITAEARKLAVVLVNAVVEETLD